MLKLIAAASVCIAVLVSSVNQREAPSARSAAADDPIVSVRRDGGMGGPIVTLHFALWADGTMLCPSTIADPDSSLMVAKAPPGAVEQLLTRLEAAQFFDRESMMLWPPDGSHTVILAASGEKRNTHAWTEHLNVGQKSTPEWDRFLQMWLDTRAAILRVRPEPVGLIENKLDENGRFRGYHPKHPERTPWLKHGWKPETSDGSGR